MVKAKFLIDTNIFLEVLFDQEKAKECLSFLKQVAEGKLEAYVSSFTLHSIEVLMGREKKLKELELFLKYLSNFKGLAIYATTLEEEKEVLKVMRRFKLDLDDAFQCYVAQKLSLELISFDRHFDKTDLKRKEPKEI